LAKRSKLPGKIKHLNGLRLADGHIVHGISLELGLLTLVMRTDASNRSGSRNFQRGFWAHCGFRLIIAVDARIVDSLGFKLSGSVS
jgi:hypothetical protein